MRGRAILADIEMMKKAIADSDAESKQKQSELSALVSEREKKCAELDEIKVGKGGGLDGRNRFWRSKRRWRRVRRRRRHCMPMRRRRRRRLRVLFLVGQ